MHLNIILCLWTLLCSGLTFETPTWPQIHCFPYPNYGERSDVPRLQQVEQKAEESRTTCHHGLDSNNE